MNGSEPCNLCLRDIDPEDDPGNGLCGPCNRLETPESQA
jgi:hypothetical protein